MSRNQKMLAVSKDLFDRMTKAAVIATAERNEPITWSKLAVEVLGRYADEVIKAKGAKIGKKK